jgi:hypothetical protein
MKYLIIPCLFLFACAPVSLRTPNPTNPELTLPEQFFIEGIKINYGQAFSDCVPVCLEAVFKFYGVSMDRKEIANRVQLFTGTKLPAMVNYVKGQGFNIDTFVDENEDKKLIKYFLSQKLPVLAPIGNVGIGHMVVLTGYDESKRIFCVADPGRRGLQEWRYFDFYQWHRYHGSLGFLVYPKSTDFQTIAYYTKVIENDPKSAETVYNRGNAYYEKGLYEQAISDYNRALEINPRYAIVYNNLAWLLATAEKASIRDGRKAVELALKACELSDWKNPLYLFTLAAAYARFGDFDNAVKWQEKAMEFSEVANKTEGQQRLQFYKKGRPWPPNDMWR